MEFPMLKPIPTTRQMLDVFGGYDRRPRPAEGAFAQMENMSSRHYPLLAPREKRGDWHFRFYPETPLLGFGYCCGFCRLLEDGSFQLDGRKRVYINEVVTPDSDKTLVPMGGKLFVFPDKMWINCALLAGELTDETAFIPGTGAMEMEWEGLATLSGNEKTGELYIQAPHIQGNFQVGDMVKVTHTTYKSSFSEPTKTSWFTTILKAESDCLVVRGENGVAGGIADEQEVRVARRAPQMDLVIECGNRLWGCRYGMNAEGEFVNAIYCSSLGDPTNWHQLSGESTGSWEVSIGVDGPFTGAATYLGRPVFFKENTILTVYGSYPAQFQLKTVEAPGVRPGCAGSLAAVGDKLYYLGRDGVYAYDGALPVPVSRELGSISGDQVCAGGHNGKYYLSCPEGLLVYDTFRQMWHREDSLAVYSFLSAQGKLFALDRDSRSLRVLVGAAPFDGEDAWETAEEKPVSWLAETGPLGLETPDAKRITALTLRLWMDRGSKLKVFVRYDFDRDWECVAALTARDLGSRRIPIHPKRCDHMYLRLEGEGDFRLYSITKTLQEGSELH